MAVCAMCPYNARKGSRARRWHCGVELVADSRGDDTADLLVVAHLGRLLLLLRLAYSRLVAEL